MSAPKNWQTMESSGRILFSTANTNRDGTGTLATVLTGVAGGTHAVRINLSAIGSTSEGCIRIWVYDGSNAALITEIRVPANVPAIGVANSQNFNPVWSYQWRGVLKLKSTSFILKVSTHIGESFHALAEGDGY